MRRPRAAGRRRAAEARGRGGFTLIEVLVTLAIVLALSALVLPASVAAVRAARFEAAAREVEFAAAGARARAMSSGRGQELAVSAGGAGVRVVVRGVEEPGEPGMEREMTTLDAALSLSILAATVESESDDPAEPGAGSAGVDGGASVEELRFYADGSARSGEVRLSGLGRAARWRVAPVTGRLVRVTDGAEVGP